MHCDKCGVKSQGGFRCRGCRAVLGWAWILGMAALAWAAGVALYLVMSRLMYPDIVKMFDGLGSEPPVPARLYFVLSGWLFPVVAALVVLVPILIASLGRKTPERLRVWARRYALTAIAGVGWGLLGVAAWYICVTGIINVLK